MINAGVRQPALLMKMGKGTGVGSESKWLRTSTRCLKCGGYPSLFTPSEKEIRMDARLFHTAHKESFTKIRFN